MREQPRAQRTFVLTQIAQRLLDLVPDATRILVAEIERNDVGPAITTVANALAQARAKNPRVDAIARDLEAAHQHDLP